MDTDAVVLDGFHAVKHAVRFGAGVERVLTLSLAELERLCGELAPDVAPRVLAVAVQADRDELLGVVPRVHATGVVGLARRPVAGVRGRPGPVVVLDNPRNLGNIGAVVRLAAGFGVAGVVTTGDADPWHPNVVRGAAGLHFATAVERLTPDELTALAGRRPVLALDPEGESIHGVPFPDDALLVFGSERHGLSPQNRALATRLVAVPMRPLVSSFNLATSVGMALFHWQAGRAA